MISEAPRIPILQIEDYLVASIQTELHDQIAVQFKDDLLQRIYDTKTRGVVIDLTAMEVVDSFIARIIGDLAEMARLMGAKVVVTGLQPAVAITLVELGVEMRGIVTALNLEKGIATLHRMVNDELFAPAPSRTKDTDSFGKLGAVWPNLGSGKTNAV